MSYRGKLGDVVETDRSVGVFSSEWRIPGFLSLPGEGGDRYESPVFDACDRRWCFKIYPKGLWRDLPSPWVSLILYILDGSPSQTLDVMLGIRGAEGVEHKRGRRQEFAKDDRACFWYEFCSRSNLTEQKSKLLPGDVLIISLDIKSVMPSIAREASTQTDEDCKRAEVPTVENPSLEKQERIQTLEQRVENYELESEDHKKEISTLESEKLSIAEEYKCLLEEKLTLEKVNEQLRKEVESLMEQNKDLREVCEEQSHNILKASSELRKAETDDDTVEKNNSGEDNEESKNGKNVKQQSQVKSTKKISLPARHGDVIRSLKAILAGGRRADFRLKSGGGEWPVHRAILEGRSGHFGALFRGEWAERSEVRLDDVPEGALDGVLHFVYAGEVGDMSAESVCGTYVAAHRFLLPDLKSLCVEYMEGRMRPEMVCGALAVAETHGEGDLKERAKECFFRETGRIVATEGWKELKEKHPAIIAELFQEFIRRERKNRRKGGEE